MPAVPSALLLYKDFLGICPWASILPPRCSSREECDMRSWQVNSSYYSLFQKQWLVDQPYQTVQLQHAHTARREGTCVSGPLPVTFSFICSLEFPEKRNVEAKEERSLRHAFMGDILLGMKAFISLLKLFSIWSLTCLLILGWELRELGSSPYSGMHLKCCLESTSTSVGFYFLFFKI